MPFKLGNLGAYQNFFNQNGDEETGGWFGDSHFKTGFLYFCLSIFVKKLVLMGFCVPGHKMSMHFMVTIVVTVHSDLETSLELIWLRLTFLTTNDWLHEV